MSAASRWRPEDAGADVNAIFPADLASGEVALAYGPAAIEPFLAKMAAEEFEGGEAKDA